MNYENLTKETLPVEFQNRIERFNRLFSAATDHSFEEDDLFEYEMLCIKQALSFSEFFQDFGDEQYQDFLKQYESLYDLVDAIKDKLQFFDNSSMVISDTSNVKVYKFNSQTQLYVYIPYYINGVKNPLIDITFPDNSFLQATVNYRPLLTKGKHEFRFVSSDVSGNFADSVLNTVVVDDQMKIMDMANYPNPMKTETNFMFRLSGELNPSSCKLKIYTVTGRLIKEINAPASVGYNNIFWDGKDTDGDYLANGTYLYKFVIQGDSQTETSIQKLAILR